MEAGVVIIGGGHGAGQAAVSLRRGGYDGPVTIVGEEPLAPYQRPPLSKAYLMGELPMDRLALRPADFYAREGVALRLGYRAERVDRERKQVHLRGGEALAYDNLILATGARARRLQCPGANDHRIHYLRTAADADILRPALKKGARLAIVGAGYIGLEVAAVARSLSLSVTVIEADSRVMARVTGPEISGFFEEEHRKAGVNMHFGAALERFEPSADALGLVLADGSRVMADLCVVGIGVLPNDELAAKCGLSTADGIVVDDHTRTEDPAIYAIGDCTRHPNTGLGAPVRLESVHNALEQAKTAAAAVCGNPAPYDQTPWFWSDQYDLKLQTVGLLTGHDTRIVRGDPARRSFSVFYLREGRIAAMDAVNAPADFMAAKMMAAKKIGAEPGVLANASLPLKALL